MKKFLIRFFIFITPIVILAYPADLLVSYGALHSTLADGELETWDDIYAGQINSEYVIYGSSRAWVHIDPILIEKETGSKAYNMGMDAHNFYLQNLRHRKLLEYNEKPKAIIYGLDMFTLEKRSDLYNLDQFLPIMLWDKDIEQTTKSYIGFSWIDYKIPFFRYVGRFNAIKSGVKYYIYPDDRFRSKGYKGREQEWSSQLDEAKENIGLYRATLDTMSVRLFESFIKECKQNDIPLIFVYTPEYIDGQRFIANRDSVINIYNSWSKKYDIPFLDYSDDSICFDKQYFYNSMHMNKRGSELFTRKLINDLVNRNLIESNTIQAIKD